MFSMARFPREVDGRRCHVPRFHGLSTPIPAWFLGENLCSRSFSCLPTVVFQLPVSNSPPGTRREGSLPKLTVRSWDTHAHKLTRRALYGSVIIPLGEWEYCTFSAPCPRSLPVPTSPRPSSLSVWVLLFHLVASFHPNGPEQTTHGTNEPGTEVTSLDSIRGS